MTWNVRGMYVSSRRVFWREVLREIKMDVALLQEMKPSNFEL